MALTAEEEAKVKKIITAYDNGKRLNELPVADSSNPLLLMFYSIPLISHI